MKTVILTEDEFQTLLKGGFFVTILRCPEVGVFRGVGPVGALAVTVHLPGHGAVQLAAD